MQQFLLHKQSSIKYKAYIPIAIGSARQQMLNSTTKAGYQILLLLISFFLFHISLKAQNAQVPIGYWREHLNYNSAQAVVKGDKIYCATANNVFSVDANNNEQRYSKINGLNDIGVSAIGWDETTQQLVITYTNCNIDVVKGDVVNNIGDIQRSAVVGNKTINSIYCNGGFAYLCSGLGVIVLNLTKYEVNDAWYIGNGGGEVVVNAITTDGNFWYAATNEGLKQASVNAANLANYNNWQNLSGSNGLSDGVTQNAVLASGKLLVQKNDTLLVQNSSGFAILYTDSNWQITNLNSSNGKLLLCQQNKQTGIGRVLQIHANGAIETTLTNSTYIVLPRQAMVDNNSLWIADSSEGLSKYNTSFSSYIPDGPLGTADGDMLVANNTLYAAAGSVDANWQALQNRNGLYTFNGDAWNTIGYYSKPIFDSVLDIVTLAIDPANQSIWAGSYGGGLVNIDGATTKIYKANNSSLQPTIGTNKDIRVSGLAFDNTNNLWISNYGAAQNISVRKADGSYKSFAIPFIHTGNAVAQITIDDANQLWIVSPLGNGLFVYNYGSSIDAVNDDQWKFFKTGVGSGNLPINTVYCTAKDKNGFIWIGTAKGIAVVQCPTEVFTQNCEAILPVVQQDSFAGYLFQDEEVHTIAVDGANRKWVGTKNGVWLISPEGDNIIYRFTADNSPLLNNDIKRIAIDPQSGEVYIATAAGICSFRSTATEGGETNSNVLVFPNPVPPNYNGTIAIKGLVDNALVKIAELDGRLVYQTRALGGQAIWNGKNYKGEQIASGVYLVIVRDDTGLEKIVTKIVLVK
ncbi:two-component regulator propeller domain-containing protein [Parasediminibacterium paludis]|uniref:Two-component regulator propeller domain-containing protein n=1 Tax=Parasediminibacterium paludis TaxID=908966 RepID=A0ABV8PZP7_9BACT